MLPITPPILVLLSLVWWRWAVLQAIFLVIVADALFSIAFSVLGL